MNDLSIRIQAIFDMDKKPGELWTDYFKRLDKAGRMDQKSIMLVMAVVLDTKEVEYGNKKTRTKEN